MIGIRVLLWSVIGAGTLALLGSWSYGLYFSRLNRSTEIAFCVFGAVGAIVGAIAATAQSISEQLQKHKPDKTSTQS